MPKTPLNVLKAEWYGASTLKPDNGPALTRALRSCASLGGACRLEFTKGIYRFAGNEALYFGGLTDFALDGQGSIFLFSRSNFVRNGQSPPLFFLQNLLRCRFMNLIVDWDEDVWRLASVGLLEQANTTVWRFRIMDWKADLSKIWGFQSIHMVDPANWNMGVLNGQEFFLRDMQIQADNLGDCEFGTCTIIQLKFNRPYYAVPKVGVPWLIKHFIYDVAAFAVKTCTHCSWFNIKWLGNPGKALTIGESSQFISIQQSRVGKKAGRSIGPTADGIFIAKTRGNILIEDTEISWQGDDCFNVHNPIAANGLKKLDSNVLLVTNSPTWKTPFNSGDLVHTLDGNFRRNGFIAKVNKATFDPSTVSWTLNLDRSIPARWTDNQLKKMPLVNTKFVGANVILRRVNCHDNRARGFLIQTPKTLVESCRLYNIQMACTAVRASEDWGEGTGVRDALFVNNRFENCDRSTTSSDKGVFRIDGEIMNGSYAAPETLHSNVSFVNNLIVNVKGRVAEMSAVENATFANNVIVNVAGVYDSVDSTFFINGDAKEALTSDMTGPAVLVLRQSRFVNIFNNTWIMPSPQPWNAPLQSTAQEWTFYGNQVGLDTLNYTLLPTLTSASSK